MTVNPFPSQGVSEFPLKTPFIGQELIYKELKLFKKLSEDEKKEHCFILTGDWGEGKSRIGHEIIAQILEVSQQGWHVKGHSQEKIFSKQDQIFPIFLPFRQVWTGKYEITEKDLIPALIVRSFEILIDLNITSIQHIRNYIKSINEDFYSRLESMIRKKTINLEKFAQELVEFVLSNGFKNIYLIFDEVEAPGDLENTTEEDRSSELKYEMADLNMTARRIKEATSGETLRFDHLNIIFLCSIAANDAFANVKANKRRVKLKKIDKIYFEDYLFYMELLAVSHPEIPQMFSKDLIAAMYIITDGNFGWYNYLANQLYYVIKDNPGFSTSNLLKEILPTNAYLFDKIVVDNILSESKVKEIKNYEERLYSYFPQERNSIQNIKDFLTIGTSYGKNFSILSKIKITSGQLNKYLTDKRIFEYERIEAGLPSQLKLTSKSHSHKQIQKDFHKNLLIFPDLEDKECFYIYNDFEAFSIFFNYCLNDEYPNEIIEPIHKALLSFSDKKEYVGLSFEYLLFVNLRMKIRSQKKIWLYRDIWNQVLNEISEIEEKNERTRKKRMKIILGILNILTYIDGDKKCSSVYDNHDDEIKGLEKEAFYYFIKNLSENSIMNISENNSLILLYLRTSNYIDLFKILKKKIINHGICPIIIIFNTDDEMDDAIKIAKNFNILNDCLIPIVINNGSVEYNFYLKFGFYNNTDFSDNNISFTYSDITEWNIIDGYYNKFKKIIEEWKTNLETNELIFKPLLLTYDKTDKKITLLTLPRLIEIYKTIHKNQEHKQALTAILKEIWPDEAFIKKFPSVFETNYINELENISPIILPEDIDGFEKNNTIFKLNFPQLLRKLIDFLSEKKKMSEITKYFFFDSKKYNRIDKNLPGPPLKSALDFLTDFYIIRKDKDYYEAITASNIDTLSKDAQNYIDILLNDDSDDSIEAIETIVKDNILIKLKINKDNIKRINSRIEDLIKRGVVELIKDFQTKEDNEVINILFKIREIPEEFNAYIKKNQKKDTLKSKSNKELMELQQSLCSTKISIDNSLSDRVIYAQVITEKLISTKDNLTNKLETSRNNLKNKFSTINSTIFPLNTSVFSKFDEMQEDVNFNLTEKHSITSIRNKIDIKDPLVILRGNGEILSIIEVCEKYSDLIESYEDNIEDIYDGLKIDFFDKWEGVSEQKKVLETYLEGVSSFKNQLDDISKIFDKHEPYYTKFGEIPEVAGMSLDDLNILKNTLKDKLTDIEGKIGDLRTSAKQDIQDKIDATNLDYLNDIEERLKRDKTTDESIWDLNTYLDQIKETEKFKGEVEERALNYFNNDGKLWDTYKSVIDDIGEGIKAHKEIYEDNIEFFNAIDDLQPNLFKIDTKITIS